MIPGRELHSWAVETLALGNPSPEAIRRGISGLYYGLFQRLAAEGAAAFASFGPAMQRRVTRTYDHGKMKRLCVLYVEWGVKKTQPPSDILIELTPDERIKLLARAFTALQEARHAADYDLEATIERAFSLELLELAEAAHWKLDELQGSPTLSTFLAALLLDDKLIRRG